MPASCNRRCRLHENLATDGHVEAELDNSCEEFCYTTMPAALDKLSQDALLLPPDQRVALAYRLLTSVEPSPQPGAEAAWEVEIARRIARFDSGESATIPADEVFARLRQIAPGE